MNTPISRRAFVQGTAAAAGLLVFPRGLLGQEADVPSRKLAVACIGVGGQGGAAVDAMAGENIVALCDVDDKRAAPTFERVPDAARYKDWRVMLDEIGDRIDAVTISTPDHSHFAPAMAAMRAGKHVYLEKPLAHSIREARQLRQMAEKTGVRTQMGNQGHANEGTRLMREWIQAGAIGPVRVVHHWTDRPIWPQGIERPDHSECVPVCPPELDWDLWLGTSPERPYDPAYLPFNWRGWWDFGTGALGDMGCHIMDGAFWALDLGHPTEVEAITSPVNEETAPTASIVTYRFPARGEMPPVTVHWYDGGLKPNVPASLEADRTWPDNGTLLVGDDGMMLTNTYNSSVRIIPEEKMQAFLPNRPPKSIPRVEGGPFAEWLRACKGGDPAGSNFSYSGPLTEVVLLGNLAIRSGRPLRWDGEKMEVTNFPDANRYVRTEYRPGWGV
jgi:predicted dehydrogenase